MEGDNGLGLSEFLDGKSHGESEPKEEVEASSSETTEEKKDETAKVEEEKKDDVSTAGEKSGEVKQEGSPATDAKVEVKKEEKKEESQAKPAVDWESDDNPFKKRQRDTSAWANKVNQENAVLKRQLSTMSQQMEILGKKVDGTYDPERDVIRDDSPSPEQIATHAMNYGKTQASKQAAYTIHGQQKVDKELEEFHTTFNENPVVQARVLGSDSPVLEAMKVMNEHRFMGKYGRDPESILSKIREEILKEEEPKIREKVRAEILVQSEKKDKTPSGVSVIRGGSSTKTEVKQSKGDSLKSIFGR